MESGLHADSAAIFIVSLVSGTLFGGPQITTAVFDDASTSGGIVLIEDLELRRRILWLYARIEVIAMRWANATNEVDAQLYSVIARHLPSGLTQRSGADWRLDEGRFTPGQLRSIATAVGADESLLRRDPCRDPGKGGSTGIHGELPAGDGDRSQ